MGWVKKKGGKADEWGSVVMHKFADLIERDMEVLAKLESANTGKGIRICR
jgi:acyl-CoA reductase-like NAD-dependent aldehyde dehydrogenase